MMFSLGQVKQAKKKYFLIGDFVYEFSCKLLKAVKECSSCEDVMIRKYLLQKHILIMLGGLGIFFGYANPFQTVPFLVLLYPFSLYLLAHTSKNYLRESLVTGMIGYGSAFYWIAVTANIYGAVPYVLAVFFPLLLGFYFGLYGTAVAFYARKIRHFPPLCKVCGLGLFWYFCELFRGWFLTGFSWFTLSSAFAPLPVMIQGANIFGSYVLSGIFAVSAFCFAELVLMPRQAKRGSVLRSVRGIGQFSGVIVLFSLYFYGAAVLQNAVPMEYQSMVKVMRKKLDIPYRAVHEFPSVQGQAVHKAYKWTDRDMVYFSVIQGNISQNIKWSPLFQEDCMKKFIRLSEEAQSTLNGKSILVYPEIAFPITSYHHKELYRELLDWSGDKTLLLGIPYFDGGNYYNSMELIQNGKSLARYAKEHLVPFGEYVPSLPFLSYFEEILAQYGGAYTSGKNEKGIIDFRFQDKTVSVLPLICYEAIFPELTWKRLQGNSAHVLLNVSNDAWYDKTSAPYQHLYSAVMRSVESGLPMIRASNTGISAFIDKYGQIQMQTELFTDESLTMPLAVRTYEPTVFIGLAPYLPYIGIVLFGFLQMFGVLRHRLETPHGGKDRAGTD